MKTLNRIVSCSVITALLGISGCIIDPGHMRRGNDRDDQRDHGRYSHHRDHDRHDHDDCDRHDENCDRHER